MFEPFGFLSQDDRLLSEDDSQQAQGRLVGSSSSMPNQAETIANFLHPVQLAYNAAPLSKKTIVIQTLELRTAKFQCCKADLGTSLAPSNQLQKETPNQRKHTSPSLLRLFLSRCVFLAVPWPLGSAVEKS